MCAGIRFFPPEFLFSPIDKFNGRPMVKLVVQKFGKIPEEQATEITTTIEECYERLMPHEVEILDLLLFENSSAMKSFYSRERAALGVVSEDFGEKFFASHDAWRGTSRISVCLERIGELPRLVQVGTLRHEVGHSVLHGSMEYYIFSIPQPLTEASERFGLSEKFSFNLLYLISIAVKDFEVTRLLSGKGYVEDQVAYSKYMLSTSEDDLAAWRIAEGKPADMALCLAGRLKDAACVIGLRLGEPSIAEWIRNELSYLPDQMVEDFLKVVEEFQRRMVGDTFQNVNAAVEIFLRGLLEPLFSKERTP